VIGAGLVWGLVFLGCEEPVDFSAVTEVLDLTAPERIAVGSAIGVLQVIVPLRVVNSYEATVPGSGFEVQVDGEALASYEAWVVPDALGFATLEIASEQPQKIEVLVIAANGNTKVGDLDYSWLTGTDRRADPLQRAFGLESWPDFVSRATGGVAYAIESQVYYQRFDMPVPPDLVLDLPDLIVGMTAVDLDRDGYQDLLVWTQARLVLLRGRGTAGYAWSTAFTTPGARVRGVHVADFDGDRLPDLAIGFAEVDGIFTGAQVLLQDGVGSWKALPPLRRDLDITDVALGDFVGEGLSEVVLLTDEGPYRYGYVEGWVEPDRAWNRIDPNLTWLLDPGATFLPSRDLDGEGTPELIGVGEAASLDGNLHLSFYTIGETATRFDIGFRDFVSDMVDITGDGIDDIAVLVKDGEKAQLRTITTDAADGSFKNRGLANLPFLGELAVGDLDGDGDRDVVVAGALLWTYEGQLEDGDWSIDDSATTTFDLSLVGPVYLHDWDQDGRTDVLAVREVTAGVVLQHFEIGMDAQTGSTVLQAYDGGQVLVDEHDPVVKARGLGLTICDNEHIYLLIEDGDTVAWRLRLDNQGGIEAKASGVVNGTMIACGDLVSGAVAAVVTESGDVTEFNGSIATVANYNVGGAAYGLAVADVDGTGASVQVCDTPGCSLAVLDLDGDGVQELLVGGDDAVLRFTGREVALGVSGLAGVADLDGDGGTDLVLTDTATGSVAQFFYAGSDRMPVYWLHTRREIQSAVYYGDVDTDGVPELWFVSEDGTLIHTAPSGESDGSSEDTGADTGD
jgi:hypothetical protein